VFRKIVSSAIFASAIIATPAFAQRARTTQFGEASLSISPYAGYMTFGQIIDGPLNTSLKSSAAPVYGLQLNLPLGSTLSIVGNLAYTEPNLSVGIPIIGDMSFGKSDVWIYDGGIQLSAPGYGTGDRGIFPFVQGGVGAMKYDVQVSGTSRNATNTAWNAGVGVDVPLMQNVGLRLLAKDYIGKFDFNQATSLNVDAKTSHNIALTAGLRLGF
jgi:opacity protein-like surface antigen